MVKFEVELSNAAGAAAAATGHASSTIFCDCEAGIDRFVGPGGDESVETPDGRPGVILQFHVPRFVKNRERHLEKTLLHRLSQNILTCPTTRCFNLLNTDASFKLGRKMALFGDGYQFRDRRHGRPVCLCLPGTRRSSRDDRRPREGRGRHPRVSGG